MIIRDRPTGPHLFFIVKGSILKRILVPLAGNALTAILVTLAHGELLNHKIVVTTAPFSLIGLALAIFLGFRNSAAFDRYWEARKLWGELIHRSRSLSRQVLSMVQENGPALASNGLTDVRVRFIYRAIALAHASRHYLRGTPPGPDTKPFLQPEEWEAMQKITNPPDYLLQRMGTDLRLCLDTGRIDTNIACGIDQTLSSLAAAVAGCERIKGTPIPFPYALLLHRTAYLYCFLLPFGLVDTLGATTPFVVTFVAYTFFGLDAVGDAIEQPFGSGPDDLPLNALCRHIEVNLREALVDTNIPPLLEPVDYCLN